MGIDSIAAKVANSNNTWRAANAEQCAVDDGKHYFCSFSTSIAAASTWQMVITAPASSVAIASMNMYFSMLSSAMLYVNESSDSTSISSTITAMTGYNNNRNSTYTTNLSFGTLATSSGTAANGSTLFTLVVSSYQPGIIGGSPMDVYKLKLKSNQDYLVRVVPGAANSSFNVMMNWYEE